MRTQLEISDGAEDTEYLHTPELQSAPDGPSSNLDLGSLECSHVVNEAYVKLFQDSVRSLVLKREVGATLKHWRG